jgi:hypothetical protein
MIEGRIVSSYLLGVSFSPAAARVKAAQRTLW